MFGAEWVGGMGQCLGGWGVVICVCVLRVWIICVDGKSRYLYIVLGGFLRILCAPSVQSCCTLSISTCMCLWQISQIQTCLRAVVGPGLVSTSPAFMRSIARHPAGPHGRLAQKRKSGPHCWGREGSTQFAQRLPDRCDSYTSK